MTLQDHLIAIFKLCPDNNATRDVMRMAQLLFSINSSTMFNGRQYVGGLITIPNALLQDVVSSSRNPMAALVGEEVVTPWDLHRAHWELARRKWVKEGGVWNFNHLPYLLDGEVPHDTNGRKLT